MTFKSQIKDFITERHRRYVKKKRRLIFSSILVIILGSAIAIALSKYIHMILLSIAVIAIIFLTFHYIKKFEFFSVIKKFIQGVLDKLADLIFKKEQELEQFTNNPAEFSLLELFSSANKEEREGLENFVGKKFEDPTSFETIVRQKATDGIGLIVKRIRGVDKELALSSYSDMLDLAGEQLKLKRESRGDRDFEIHIIQTAFDQMVKEMDEKSRKVLEHEVKKYAEENLNSSNLDIVLSSSSLLAANLGGFATYTMASSLLAGVTSLFGFTLPFAAYTGLSTIISTALGPIGFGALGLWGLKKITSADIKTTVLVVLAAASIRERLIYEHEEKVKEIKNELQSYLIEKREVEELLKILNTEKSPNLALERITYTGNKLVK